MYTPDPLNYGGLQGYDRTAQPDPWANVPMQTVEGTTVPGEVTASDVSVTGSSVTVSGPVEMPTSTPTETSTFTPAPTTTSVSTPDVENPKVSIEADTSSLDQAIATINELNDKTINVNVQTDGVS